MLNKKFVLAFSLSLLAASCNPFAKSLPAGVIKTSNGGVDWQFTNKLNGSATGSLNSASISKLAFDPSSNQIIFAGSYTSGMFRSDDAGASWTSILSNITVYDFAVNSNDDKTIYAAGICVNHGCVVKTTNGGASWDNEVYHDGSSTLNTVRSLAINPSNPSQLVIGLTSGLVIKSNDGGMTWQQLQNFNDQVNRVMWQGGNIYALLKTKGLFESTDQGASFSDISSTLPKSINIAQLYSPNSISLFTQGYVDPITPTLIYLTTDRGLLKTTDGGKTWNTLNLPVKIASGDTARAITISQTSSNVVMASVGSTIYKSSDGGTTWQTHGMTTAGFINYVLIDPLRDQIAYAGVYITQ